MTRGNWEMGLGINRESRGPDAKYPGKVGILSMEASSNVVQCKLKSTIFESCRVELALVKRFFETSSQIIITIQMRQSLTNGESN